MEGSGDSKQQFMQITGATAIEAQFYLDSCQWDVHNAINTYFAENEHGGRRDLMKRQQERQSEGSDSAVRKPAFKSGLPSNEGPRIATLSSSSRDTAAHGTNEYYAGGEKSGQVVRANDEDDEDMEDEDDEKGDRVGSLMQTALRHGAEHSTRPLPGSQQTRRGLQAFSGTGRTLAGNEPVERQAEEEPQQATPQCVITFYRNNVFTVDDGPPRAIADPANHAFVQTLVKGQLPPELQQKYGREVSVDLVRKDADYKEPEKPSYVPFSGRGRRMDEGQSSSSATTQAAQPGPEEPIATAWAGADTSRPVTSLQIRMHDGQRMVAQFNMHHRIAEIRGFLAASRPDLQAPYQLMQAYPVKVLADEELTLEEAGLKNAAITVRLV